MPQEFKLSDKVQNTKTTSDYYGQIGEVIDKRTATEGVRYVVSWPDGTAHVYRAASLTPALIPEKSFLSSDSGFRKQVSGDSKKTTKHRVPASPRPSLCSQ